MPAKVVYNLNESSQKTTIMDKVTNPTVKVLATGDKFVAKQMQGKAGYLLPKHLANVESVIFIHEGECILNINEEDKILKPGDAFIIPPNIKHHFKAITDFKGIHMMPKEIKFQFFE